MRWKAIQAAILGICFVYILAVLAAERPSQTPFETVQQAVTKNLDLVRYPRQDEEGIQEYLDLSPSEYEQAILFRSDDRLYAQELFLVKCSEEQQENIVRKLEARKASQQAAYDPALPEEKDMAEAALIDVHPNYILYVAGKDAKAIQKKFEDAL